MAQLKSTSVTGNLSVTGNTIASKFIKSGGSKNELLLANGETTSLNTINANILTAQSTAEEAHILASEKTTMAQVEAKDYATKTQLASTKTEILGDQNYNGTVKGAYEAAESANTNANSKVPKNGDTTITGNLTANQFIGPLQGYARCLETKKRDKDGNDGWYGSNYNFYTQWDEDTNNICELKTVGNYDTRATRAFKDGNGLTIADTYLKLTGGTITGSLKIDGTVEASSYNATSDARLKENFMQFTPKKSILDLPIYKFDFINGTKNQIGCKAQDLQEICPEIVIENEDGYLSIQESKIVYLLIDEIKKLKSEINSIKAG